MGGLDRRQQRCLHLESPKNAVLKDLVNSVLQAIVESFATVVRKSIVKRNVQGSSIMSEAKTRDDVICRCSNSFIRTIEVLVFHGKKASLFIRSKCDQEKVSSKTLDIVPLQPTVALTMNDYVCELVKNTFNSISTT